MYVLIFSTTFVCSISHSKKKWARCEKNVYCCSCQVPIVLVIFQGNLNFSTDFQKILKYQIHEDPSSDSRVVPCGQIGGQMSQS
jgi:hypothetical protein